MQIQRIIRNYRREKPKILTVYNSHSTLNMLRDFPVYCLMVPQLIEPRQNINFPNVVQVNNYTSIEYDLCLSFSGGMSSRILLDAAKHGNTELIKYEMEYVFDIVSGCKYRASKSSNSIFPNKSFMSRVFGSGDIIGPYIGDMNRTIPIYNRPLNVIIIGDNLVESELSSNFSDWHFLVNTLPGCSVLGFNPRLGTQSFLFEESQNVFNHAKIYVNTRQYGMFPTEIIQAMACGCVVISYDYPGIEEILPKQFIVKNKEECRALISSLVYDNETLNYISDVNVSIFKNGNYNNNKLTGYILKKWEDIREHSFEFHRLHRA